jgi:hypothetical protein
MRVLEDRPAGSARAELPTGQRKAAQPRRRRDILGKTVITAEDAADMRRCQLQPAAVARVRADESR